MNKLKLSVQTYDDKSYLVIDTSYSVLGQSFNFSDYNLTSVNNLDPDYFSPNNVLFEANKKNARAIQDLAYDYNIDIGSTAKTYLDSLISSDQQDSDLLTEGSRLTLTGRIKKTFDFLEFSVLSYVPLFIFLLLSSQKNYIAEEKRIRYGKKSKLEQTLDQIKDNEEHSFTWH